ncbi:MAG: branched-chain amino acid ABC transporter permease [Chloroflexota bacterium]
MIDYGITFVTVVLMYALLAQGLNLHWGYAGLYNIGIAAFFAIGGYTAALISSPGPNLAVRDDFVWAGDLAAVFRQVPLIGSLEIWFVIAICGAAVVGGLFALPIGFMTLRLRGDYLAIATLGVTEVARAVILNERWLTNGSKGLYKVPQVFPSILPPADYEKIYLVVVFVVVLVIGMAIKKMMDSPWARALSAFRDNAVGVESAGIDTRKLQLQVFVIGAAIMSLAGALFAFDLRAISPNGYTHLAGTFLIWVMLMVGGSGRFWGPFLGAGVVWAVWSWSQFAPGWFSSADARFVIIGLLLICVQLLAPKGIGGFLSRKKTRGN